MEESARYTKSASLVPDLLPDISVKSEECIKKEVEEHDSQCENSDVMKLESVDVKEETLLFSQAFLYINCKSETMELSTFREITDNIKQDGVNEAGTGTEGVGTILFESPQHQALLLGCNMCNREFSTQTLLDRHMCTHERGVLRPLTKDSSESFNVFAGSSSEDSNSVGLLNVQSTDKLLICVVCGKKFSHKGNMSRHMNTHSHKNQYPCSVCSKLFTSQYGLKKHMSIHTRNELFTCSHCGKTFFNRSNLTRHMKIESAGKQFSCSVCSKLFPTKGHLKAHTNIHTRNELYTCSNCNKSFLSESNLHQHMKIHSGNKPYSCSVCFKSFTTKGNLSTHMNIHTRNEVYECNYCCKSFTRRSSMKRHMLIHSGKDPDSYTVRSMSLTPNQVIKSSTNSQENNLVYTCCHCNRTFSRRNNVKQHMFTHSGKKPYSCGVCCKSFTSKGNFKIHMYIHNRNEVYSCSHCSKTFTRKSNIKRHSEIHSGKILIRVVSLVSCLLPGVS